MQLGGLGSGVSSSSGVWGRAAAEIGFDAFLPENLTSGGTNYTNIYFIFFCPAIGGREGQPPLATPLCR